MGNKEIAARLRAILSEAFNENYQGANGTRHARAQGLADGYMRALTDLGVVRQDELLALIAEERRSAIDRAESRIFPKAAHAPQAVADFA